MKARKDHTRCQRANAHCTNHLSYNFCYRNVLANKQSSPPNYAADMTSGHQPPYSALPCTFISILLTSLVVKGMAPTNGKGLATVAEAVCVFFIVLTATITAAKCILNGHVGADEDAKDDSIKPLDFAAEIRARRADYKAKRRSEHVVSWREDVAASSAKVDKAERKRVRALKKAEDKAREKKVRNMLIREFWPKRNTLLGARKGEIEEVVEDE